MSQGFVNKLPLPLPVAQGGTGATSSAAALTNLGVPNPNLIIGGNFSTNPWQRGTSFASIANGTYNADRFWWSQAGAGVVSIAKASDAPSVSQAGVLTNDCLAITTTTSKASVGAADTCNLAYFMEGYDFTYIAQQIFTLSFWVKSTKTGTFCVAAVNGGGDRSCVLEYTVNVSNTWEMKTLTFPASPASGTWNYTNGSGLLLMFAIACGSNFQNTAGSWTSSGARATANQVNGMDSTSNVFKIDLIKIERGSVATVYQPEFASDVLRKCQRYYTKSYTQGTNPGAIINNGTTSYVTANSGYGAGTLLNTTPFKVTMRTSPTVTIYSPNTGSTGFIYNVSAGGDLASFATNANDQGYALQVNNTMNTNNIFLWHYTASCEL